MKNFGGKGCKLPGAKALFLSSVGQSWEGCPSFPRSAARNSSRAVINSKTKKSNFVQMTAIHMQSFVDVGVIFFFLFYFFFFFCLHYFRKLVEPI